MDSKNKLDLSIIIPTYKRGRLLCQTISAILAQDPAPLEIIVVDQTKEHEKETADFLSLLAREGKIKHIFQDNPNASAARNRGVREASSSIVLIIDDDVVVEKHFVYAHYSNYSDPGIGAVSGLVLEADEVAVSRIPLRYYYPFTGWMYFPLNYAHRHQVINLSSCNLSVRKELYLAVGGFDENFTITYFDDTDFSLRLHKLCAKKKLKAFHDPQASLRHLVEPSVSGPSGMDEFVIAERNTWKIWMYFFLINYGILSFWEVLLRLRGCVFRKKNILRPRYFLAALREFFVGSIMALRLILKGRKLDYQGKQ